MDPLTVSREQGVFGRAGGPGLQCRLRWWRIDEHATTASWTSFGIAFYRHCGCASGRKAGDCGCHDRRGKSRGAGICYGKQFAERGDVVSTHFYPTCNVQDVDSTLFSRVPQLVQYINYVYQELGTRTDLKSVPLWVTENNVNADYPNPDGTSNCNPAVKSVSDSRGTSPFFAAFRPYVFSQFGKAGNQALCHWVYAADTQYGEVDFNTGNTYLSYWVDYWLAQMFPSSGPNILQCSVTEMSSAEILATKNRDGSVGILIVDHAMHAPTDNNGVEDPRTVIVDVSALGTFFQRNVNHQWQEHERDKRTCRGKHHSRAENIGIAGEQVRFFVVSEGLAHVIVVLFQDSWHRKREARLCSHFQPPTLCRWKRRWQKCLALFRIRKQV